ncbi:putative platelet-activating factor acetylhydrolase [Amylocarpus encephaloides]|uniref:1-alkyl-2-acetylglycerophosphocholine esterase n=1 Tax=Amylocarpus encephaloides TaxID=45428 RepID=A0A9P7YQM4_9HELO|nr:putative platelet-activating factor acetylhydrolase [Amylocarpus encephaloides]
MVQDKASGMINGFWRIKWWRYRWLLVAGFLVNIFLINRFFFDRSISNLNPFPGQTSQTPLEDQLPPPTPPPPPPSAPAPTTPTTLPPPPPTPTTSPKKPSNEHAPAPPSSGAVLGPPSSASTFNLNDFDFNGEYVGWPLGRLCNETKWQPGLIFHCDNNSGGIGNIRNFILTCLRYAIEAGASGITVPQIQRRDDSDLANIFTTGMKPLEYFFDDQHFRSSFETFCPQMKIFSKRADIPHLDKVQEINEFYPKDLNVDTDGCDGRGVNRHLDQFRQKFDKWILDHKQPLSWDKPTTLVFKWATFFEWPVYRDGPEFAATFGDLLRINKDIEALAVKTIQEMSRFAGVVPSASKIVAPYLGVHLRTESDALEFWPNFDEQSNGYIQQAESRNIKLAYLASGSEADAHRFADKAHQKMGMNTTSNGYIVVGVDHPYDTTFISYPGNRTAVRYTDLNNAPDIPAEATRLAGIRSDDLIAVLHALSKNATFARQIPGAHGKLDVSSIGIFGHSLGGAAALDAMGKHPRVTCGANLDGAFWGDVAASARALKNRPFLVMAAEGHNSTNDESFRSFFGNTTASGPFGGKYLATTRGAVHNTFADLAYLYETAKAAGLPVPDVEEFGSIGGVRMLELVSMFLGEFFGRCLNGQGNILKGLEGLTRKFPEVRVE